MSGRIGKYRILARIGQGGMARVLLTMSEGPHGFNKLLVVKELREELAHDPEFLAMFLDEARIAARLNHPNIVQTYEIANDKEQYFIAMEYLEGQPLNAVFRRIGRKQIPLEIHLKILADVLAALEHAHALADFDGTPLHVVHRDVSPQNVFITYDGHVKLVDFGIAKAAGASSRTQEGILKGKISYIAPEQARCEPVDARADVFAVGLMLWEALAGRRMIQKEDEASVLARRMAGMDPSIRTVVPDIPNELATICDKAMAGRVEDRFQSAKDLQEVLEAYLARSDFRVGPKEIGRIVVDGFADERARIKKSIELAMKQADTTAEPMQIELMPASLKVTSESLPRVYAGAPSDPPAANTTALTAAMPPPSRGRSILPAVAAGSLLALVALGVVVYAKRPDTAAAGASNQAPADASAQTIDVKIRVPQGATAKLDGASVEQPFSARVPRDGSLHQLEVSQPGFETERRALTYDKDIDVDIQLRALDASASAEPVADADPEPKTRSTGGGRPRPRATAEPTTAPADPPPPDPDTPKHKPKQPSVEIDEQNPYKKGK